MYSPKPLWRHNALALRIPSQGALKKTFARPEANPETTNQAKPETAQSPTAERTKLDLDRGPKDFYKAATHSQARTYTSRRLLMKWSPKPTVGHEKKKVVI